MPFHWRLITLLAILALVATYETCVLRKTVRLKEYATLVACAAIFGIYGALNDVVTGTLSPEYFVLGKEVADDAYRFWRIIAVGASAGCVGRIHPRRAAPIRPIAVRQQNLTATPVVPCGNSTGYGRGDVHCVPALVSASASSWHRRLGNRDHG